jgi:MFS family permease
MSAPAIPRPLLDDLRALPKPFWVLLAGTFINRFGTFVMPFLTIYLYQQGHSLVVASFAVSAFGFGTLCGSTLGGWLADRIGRKHTIAIGAFASSVFYMLLYCAGSMPAIVVCAALAGLGAGTYPPASSALLADVVPEDRRVRAWSALRVALNAGFACGVASAGFLAKISFFWLFAGDALTTAIYGCIALAALPHGLRSVEAKAPWPEALRHIRGNRAFHLTFAAALCVALIFSQFGSAYSVHVVLLGLSLDVFGFHLTGETIYASSWVGMGCSSSSWNCRSPASRCATIHAGRWPSATSCSAPGLLSTPLPPACHSSSLR